VPRETFEAELKALREQLLEMASMVESQIHEALEALQRLDGDRALQVRSEDQRLNETFRRLREECLTVSATQQPVARDLRTLMGVIYISAELERIGDYAVRVARFTGTLCGLPHTPLRAEFGLMGSLATSQVRDILDALIEGDEGKAREVAARDDEIDRLYHRLFDDLIREMADGGGEETALRTVTLLLVAHNLERIGDRVTNVAEDIVFLQTGQVVELG
jgi:phosphate transport system protein